MHMLFNNQSNVDVSVLLIPPPTLNLQVRVLGMDLEKGVLDVTMDTDLVKVSQSPMSTKHDPIQSNPNPS